MASMASDRRNGDLVSLRGRLDRFLEKYGNDYPFMLAFDGALLFAEERNEDGKKQFAKCLDTLSSDASSDAEYVSLFCRFNLNVSDDQIRNSTREKASQLKVDSWIHWFLRFPSEERFQEIESEARARIGKAHAPDKSTKVSFDL